LLRIAVITISGWIDLPQKRKVSVKKYGLGAVETLRFVGVATACVAFLISAGALAVEQGAEAPAFDIVGQSEPVKLSDYRGKLVYLDFWASWCGPCKRSFPWMNQMQTQFGAQGLQVVAVNLDRKRSEADAFLAVTPANFTIGFDSAATVARSYGLKGMPSSVLIGPDGRIIMVHEGFNDTDRGTLESRVRLELRKIGK
jgi:cytochrome c biogenesis protein CcmG/thiol:disulfide interchange protein DsbE